MSLNVRWPDNMSELPQEQQDWLTDYWGLPHIMSSCGVGDIPSKRRSHRMPKSFVTADLLRRMQVYATLFPSTNLPSFVTVEWLDSINTLNMNVSFVTTRKWKSLCYRWLDSISESKFYLHNNRVTTTIREGPPPEDDN